MVRHFVSIVLAIQIPLCFFTTASALGDDLSIASPSSNDRVNNVAVSLCLSVEERPIHNATVECFYSSLLRNNIPIGSGVLQDGCATILPPQKSKRRSRVLNSKMMTKMMWKRSPRPSRIEDVFCRVHANGMGFASTSIRHRGRKQELLSASSSWNENAAISTTVREKKKRRRKNRRRLSKEEKRKQKENMNNKLFFDFGWVDLPYDPDYANGFQAVPDACGPYLFPGWLRTWITDWSEIGAACTAHDVCYDSCHRTRSSCDDKFAEDVQRAVCGGSSSCRRLSLLMPWVVEHLGTPACRAARKRNGCDVPAEQDLCVI